MGYAFISYSTKNQAAADAIRNLFNKHNIDTWMAPYDIPVGSKYAAVLTKSIRECSCFVLLLSNDSQASDAVDSEVELAAVTFKKAIIPVEIEKVVLNDSFTFYLHNKHIIAVQKIDEASAEIKQVLSVVRTYTIGDSTDAESSDTSDVAELTRISEQTDNIVVTKPINMMDSVVYRDIVDIDFHNWLANKGYADNIIRNYISDIYIAERYAQERNFPNFFLVSDDSEKVNLAIDALFSDDKFIEYILPDYKIMRAALSHWYEFIVELENTSTTESSVPDVTGDFIIIDGVLKDYQGSSKDVAIPESVSVIDSYCFMDKEIESVLIPGSVTSIEEGAFDGCENLKSVTLGDGVMSIGWWAFNNCVSLTSIIIPNTVINMGENVFKNCTSLTTVTLSKNLTYISEEVFFNCKSLTSITIPLKVASIGRKAFAYCESLTSIIIPKCVTSLGDEVFSDCINLTDVDVSKGLLLQSKSAFDEELYEKLVARYISTPATKKQVATDMGDFVIKDGVLTEYKGDSPEVVIPVGVTRIGDWAFCRTPSLTAITIPDSVKSIGKWAFDSCPSLASITIPDSVINIGNQAFGGCPNLTNVTISYDLLLKSKSAFDEGLYTKLVDSK